MVAPLAVEHSDEYEKTTEQFVSGISNSMVLVSQSCTQSDWPRETHTCEWLLYF